MIDIHILSHLIVIARESGSVFNLVLQMRKQAQGKVLWIDLVHIASK